MNQTNRADQLLSLVARALAVSPDFDVFKCEIVNAITNAFPGAGVEIGAGAAGPALDQAETIPLTFAGKTAGALYIRVTPALNAAERAVLADCAALIASRIAAQAADAALNTESLTGLRSRRAFERAVAQAWATGSDRDDPVAILMIDVDLFKSYNDRYGHPAGDRCLRRVADTLAATCGRPGDIISRWGGEEFIVLLTRCDSAGAIHVAESLRLAVEREQITHEGSGLGRVSISIGVACARPSEIDIATAISQADSALYAAKHRGRNRVCDKSYMSDGPRVAQIFAPIMRPRVIEALKNSVSYRIGLLSAPAGYGKSTALSEFVESVEDSVLRYNLRPANATPAGFARGLAQACEPFSPNLTRKFAETFNDRSLAHVEPAVEWFAAHLRDYRGLIVVDDVHLVLTDTSCAELIAKLVDATPESVRWLFSGRSLAGLPVATWIAYNKATEPVGLDTLRLQLPELEMIAQRVNPGVSPETLGTLDQATAGWPVAVAFALRSGADVSELAAQGASRERLYEYLSEQIFNSLPPELCDFALESALLPNLDAAVLAEMAIENAPECMTLIMEQGVFIVRDGSDAFRYHDLFRDFLVQQLRVRGIDVPALARLSARAAASAGQEEAALRLCVSFELGDVACDLIDRCFHRVWLHGDLELEAITAMLPSDTDDARIVRVGVEAALAQYQGDIARCRGLWEQLRTAPGDAGRRDRWSLRIAESLFSYIKEPDGDVLRALCERPWENPGDAIAAKTSYAAWMQYYGNVDDALQLAQAAADDAAVYGSPREQALSLRVLATAQLAGGQYEASGRSGERLRSLAAEHNMLRMQASAESLLLAYYAYEREDFRTSLEHAMSACRLADEMGTASLQRLTVLNAHVIAAEAGDAAVVRTCALKWTELADEAGAMRFDLMTISTALVIAGTGDFRRAVAITDALFGDDENVLYRDPLGFAPALAARSMYAAFAAMPDEAFSSSERALPLLDQLPGAVRGHYTVIVSYLSIAIAWIMLGRLADARTLIERTEPLVCPDRACSLAFLHFTRTLHDEAAGFATSAQRHETVAGLARVGLGGFVRIFEQLPALMAA